MKYRILIPLIFLLIFVSGCIDMPVNETPTEPIPANETPIEPIPTLDSCNQLGTEELCALHPYCKGVWAGPDCELNMICSEVMFFRCVSKN